MKNPLDDLEIKLDYVQKNTGETYILLEDVIYILKIISASNVSRILSAQIIDEIEKTVPS